MRIDILTLFPEMFPPVLGTSILGRAADAGLVRYALHNPRDHSTDRHRKVDQSPYGGGPGMVLQCQPFWDAVQHIESDDPHQPPRRLVMSPQGRPLTQPLVEELAREDRLLLIAGHYEGFDQRLLDRLADDGGVDAISIGDYVLSGGELAAMVVIDAVVRLIPGVLGDERSAYHDSFSPGSARLLDHPHYTRPRIWEGRDVPDILLSGDHQKIEAWRRERSIEATRQLRPDLMDDNTSTG